MQYEMEIFRTCICFIENVSEIVTLWVEWVFSLIDSYTNQHLVSGKGYNGFRHVGQGFKMPG